MLFCQGILVNLTSMEVTTMANINEKIINTGIIRSATKLPVFTIGLGPVSKLKDLDGVFWHDNDGNVVIATKEAPRGCIYDQDLTAVVRIIGGKVKIGGMYDIYVPSKSKVAKLLSNYKDLNTLGVDAINELAPVLNAGSEVFPSLAPAEPGRKVIVITDDMVGEDGYIFCHCPWDPEDVLTKLYPGDVFLVEDEATFMGYRIGKDEFEGTHQLDD